MSSTFSDSYGIWEQMLDAVKKDDGAQFKALLRDPRLRPDDLNMVTTTSLLTEACKLKSPAIGLELLKLGADPNQFRRGDAAPLALACAWSAGTALAEALLKAGAKVNQADDDGWTALHQAALANDAACIHLLIDHGASLLALDDEHWTPLHTSMHSGCLEAAKALVSSGAQLDAKEESGLSPAGIALRSNAFDEALWFVAQGLAPTAADLQQDPNEHYLTLSREMAAAKGGHVDLLLEMVSDGRIDPLDDSTMGVLRSAAEDADKSDVVAALDAARAQACIRAITRQTKHLGEMPT